MPIKFRSTRGDDDGKIRHPKMKDPRKYGATILQYWNESLGGLKEERIKDEVIQFLKSSLEKCAQPDVTFEEQISLEDLKRKIQRNFNEDPLAWLNKNGLKASLKVMKGKNTSL